MPTRQRLPKENCLVFMCFSLRFSSLLSSLIKMQRSINSFFQRKRKVVDLITCFQFFLIIKPKFNFVLALLVFPGGGGGTPKNLGRGVRPASQNPYPIYDQNLRFSLPYLWPEVASSKEKSNPGLECKNLHPIYYQNGGKMAKSDTLFMTKTAEKPYPLAPHIPI